MEKSMEKSVSSATSGNSISSKLRYPLRSSLRSKEGKPPVPDFSVSSLPRRGRVASAVSQSTTALDLSAKKSVVDRTKPPRRLSIPSKTPNGSSSSSVKSLSSIITSVSETKAKRSSPFPSVTRSMSRRNMEDLSSSAYWLSHIKLAESAAKHSISLGFFKLALTAGCKPIEEMKQELRSYARRNNLVGFADAMKELYELYKITDESEQMQSSETSSLLAEVAIVSLNNDNDVQGSDSTPGNSNVTSEITKDDAKEEEKALDTRKSLDVINVNQEIVQESQDGTVVQRSDKKETVPKNNKPVKTKKSLAANSAYRKTVPENKSQKRDDKITKPRTTTRKQEQNKKSAAKEGEVKTEKPMKKMENKENTVVAGGEEEI